jgi:hypothetical protein
MREVLFEPRSGYETRPAPNYGVRIAIGFALTGLLLVTVLVIAMFLVGKPM